jgi:hypothetical protein
MRPTDDGGPGSGTVSITDPCQLMPDFCYTPRPAPVIKPNPANPQLPNIPGGGYTPPSTTPMPNGPSNPPDQQNPASNNGHYRDCHGFWGCLGHDVSSALNNVSNWVDDAGGFIAANGVQISRVVGGGLLVVGGGLICTADGVVTVGTGGAAALVGVSELAGAACVGLVGGGVMIMQNAANGIHGTGGGGDSGTSPGNSVNAGDLKNVNPQRVEEATGLNPEEIKYDYLGQKASISRFDLKRDPASGYFVIVEKATQRIVEVTSYRMASG